MKLKTGSTGKLLPKLKQPEKAQKPETDQKEFEYHYSEEEVKENSKSILAFIYYLLPLVLFLFQILNSYAQHAPFALQPGDTVPKELWSFPLQVVNHPEGKQTINLNDYKGKLIIIDFWATWCTSCISHLPQLDSLQKQFDGKIQVLLVNTKFTRDKEDKIKAFFANRRNAANQPYSFPSVISDTAFNKVFEHKSIPHYAWIGTDGKIRAITGSQEINQDNIFTVLNNENFHMQVKNDVFDFSPAKPLFENGNGGSPQTLASSRLSAYAEGLTGRSGLIAQDSLFVKIYDINLSPLMLYKCALPGGDRYPVNRVVFDNVDPAKFANTESEDYDFQRRNYYCYELRVPEPCTAEKLYALMNLDLQRYFGYRSFWRKSVSPCYILKAVSIKRIPFSRGGIPDVNLDKSNRSENFIRNVPMSALTEILNDNLPLPLIDESGITKNIDMKLPADLKNIEVLKSTLKKYGLFLEEGKREIRQLVISTAGNNLHYPDNANIPLIPLNNK